MDDTVGIGDSSSSPLSEPLSSPSPVPSIETLNDAMRGTSISAEAPRSKRALDPHVEFDEAERTSRLATKRFIEQLHNGTLDHAPRKRVRRREGPDKLYYLFQCDQGHHTWIRCHEHHYKKCQYCFTSKGSVVNWKKEKCKKYTNEYLCHKGRGWVILKEDDFFCPDSFCQFCGPLDIVLNHITDVHSMTIQHFSYGEVIRIPLHLVSKYVVPIAEDGTAFVLWVDDRRLGKILFVVLAKRHNLCRSRFTLELTYHFPPVVRSWLSGEH